MLYRAFLACLIAVAPVCRAGEGEEPQLPVGVSQERIDAAIGRGLAYVVANQNRDGSWGGGSGSYSRNVGITGICCLALLANGNQPGRGRYGKNVDDAIRFLLRNTNEHTGYIEYQSSRMYEHGFAVLCLAEAYGMTPNRELQRKLQLAVRCIVRTQRPDGGWRYEPLPVGDSDLSVTVCEVQALRAARNAGIKVPKETIDRAIKYVKDSSQPTGQFSYMLQSGGGSYALAGAGVTALYGAGEWDCPELLRGIQYLRIQPQANSGHYYYGHYYASQALYQAGGGAWAEYSRRAFAELLAKQQADGSWTGGVGDVYCTGMACLVLQVHNNYLPIFQR